MKVLILRSKKDGFHNHRDLVPCCSHQFCCCMPLYGNTNFTSPKSTSKNLSFDFLYKCDFHNRCVLVPYFRRRFCCCTPSFGGINNTSSKSTLSKFYSNLVKLSFTFKFKNRSDFHNHRDLLPYSRQEFCCCTHLFGNMNFTSLKSNST